MRVPQAGVVAQVVVRALARAEERDHAECAQVGQRVRRQIVEDRGLADSLPATSPTSK